MVRKDKRGKWRYRRMITLPDGRRIRISGTPRVNTRIAAESAEMDHASMLLVGVPAEKKTHPTFAEFADEFMATYVATNNKMSERYSKRKIMARHLIPFFGAMRLDAIGARDVEKFKTGLSGRAPKTVNNILTVFRKCLDYAKQVGALSHDPPVKFVRVPRQRFDWLEPDEFTRLVDAARDWNPFACAAILLMGDAGLRAGEAVALRWTHVDFKRRSIHVAQSSWGGEVSGTKNYGDRHVPMTARLHDALKSIRGVGEATVLRRDSGAPWTYETVRHAFRRLSASTGRRVRAHVLRHTFCSRLALAGATPQQIQSLADHSDLRVTMRYMHLSKRHLGDAISLLDDEQSWQQNGNSESGG